MSEHAYEVWAPRPSRVELVVGSCRVGMRRDERGWWRATTEGGPGTPYGFSLDGGEVRADPRSAAQPDGIEGRSALVDHGAFEWHDAGFRGLAWPPVAVYECHVGTFSAEGTFDGVAAHLDHLVELGVDALELMPVASFPGRHGWGYDGVHLFAPHAPYGGPDGLKRLVDACHGVGLSVILDVVYNHVGHAGNHLAEFGPYFTDHHTTTWGPAVNFEGRGSDEVRRFVVDNAVGWVRDYHVDGLRLDAVHAIADRSAVHIVEQLTTAVRTTATSLGRHVAVVAESDLNATRFVRDVVDGGDGCDASWADDWHHELHVALTGERSGYYEDFGHRGQLACALRQGWVYTGQYSAFFGALRGRSPVGLPASRLVVALQNHDQVGNRAAGERLSALTSVARCKAAAALLCTSPFVPLLFQGEEWAASTPFRYFTDHEDPALARAVTEGRREEFASFGWDADEIADPQDPATFAASALRWDELGDDEHRDVLSWYRELLALRRARPSIGDGAVGRAVAMVEDGPVVTVRHAGMLVVANLGDGPWALDHHGAVLARSGPIEVVGGTITVPADTAVVLDDPPRAGGSTPRTVGR